MREELNARLADAKAVGTAVSVVAGGVTFELNARSRPGRWTLRNADVQVFVDEGEQVAGWNLAVHADARLLATEGAHAALALARNLADALLANVIEERLRRLDACADVADFALDDIDPRAWVTQRRTSVTTHGTFGTPYSDRHKGDRRTGFTIGKGEVSGRIYDKREELADPRREEKRIIEEALWRDTGWDGAAPVTRVELQIRGDALKELDGGGLREPDRALARLDALWSYFTRKWLRLVALGSATRKERCTTEERWRIVQGARFTSDHAEPRHRIRKRGSARGRLAYGATLNFAAACGTLLPSTIESPRAHVEGWGPERCESFIRAQVAEAHAAVFEPQVAALLAEGPERGAALVIEMRNGRIARHSRTVGEANGAREITIEDGSAPAHERRTNEGGTR